MTSIESISLPLVFLAQSEARTTAPAANQVVAIITKARALEGMQKEAIVHYGPSGDVWRMVSDEGPYLNGTDLAPFPLALFTAGLALSFVEALLGLAEREGVHIRDYRICQDSYYTMEGSAIRGNMVGGALPVETHVDLKTDAPESELRELLARAKACSPAHVYLHRRLKNTFALYHNGTRRALEGVRPSPADCEHPDPFREIGITRPEAGVAVAEDIILKLESAETIFGVEGGAGSSLQATQKRTLHVRGVARPGNAGMKEVVVRLIKPLGSTFRFLSDLPKSQGGEGRAPSGLSYLAAGVAFCFMTQIGRYGRIMKHDLGAYGLVQDTMFYTTGVSADAECVDTHTFLEMNESGEIARKTLWMSERTCFLHAAMRGSNRTRITLTNLKR